ncbi:DUF4139 domain-containing protein [Sphingomonas hankyongi]|uniref:DUF4139 domain-containing protein n=1 Tax=Sphingomonas hankyongi TaxID=2908209 RepID=A0ABT0S5H4_9SPHN|nr:DUF4139 domain-containing protein [Sphingomonas hankyongi]MCL6730820.1 DUF4139 domain-containing protein [Sphingomonas hankyongi]
MRLISLGALLAASAAYAQPVPTPAQTAQGDVAVTIYNNDRALVEDKRTLDLPAGRSRQEFRDVSAQIQPETVTLNGRGIGIVEQNFDFDLLSPSALMQNAVGQTVTLVRVNPATGAEVREPARILAANGGVVMQIGDRIEVLRDDGLPARVIFDAVPASLRARPTLSVTLDSNASGSRPVTLTYLTPGLGWAADYVALFDEANGRMDVQGWVTLTNNSGTPYVNASTLLVAGNVGQNSGYRGGYGGGYPPPPPPPPPPGVIDRAGTETATRERLGDFYLYPLPERTTIADKQTKQVSFLDVQNTPAARAYEFRNGWLSTADQPLSANTVLRFSSSRNQGLGDALPAGTVRVYQRDARGNPQFVGEHRIGHTPMGSDISLATGQAFDVKVRPVVEERTKVGDSRWRTRMRYTLTNAGPKPITVDLIQSGLWGDTRITDQSAKSERLSADEARWRVPVPANGEATVTATFDSRY